MPQLAKSPYQRLLDDTDFRRWFENVRRGSVATAHEWLRRMGFIQKTFGKGPKQIASLKPKDATNFILDVVSALESQKRSGSYISNCVKPLKSWLEFNGITIQQRIKIPGRGELTRVADERPPMPEELARILNAADLRAKVACSLVAFTGVRLEVLGDFLGDDGLQIRDFPEMVIENGVVDFEKTPTMVIIRKTLSKTKNQFFTFLCSEGCEYLKQYLEWRIRRGENPQPKSALISPQMLKLAGQHIRTINIGDLMRKPIRNAGFQWRPYVFRRYFDTRLMIAESDGLIIRDWRVFWMGHKGDMEATYTVNKQLSEDVIEKMREAYAKAAEKYLMTVKKETVTKETIVKTFNEQFLRMAGYSDEEIDQLDLESLSPQEIQDLIKKKSLQSLGLGNNSQKIIAVEDLKNHVSEGWEFICMLPNNEAIIRLPKIGD